MVRSALEAFVNKDVGLALEVCRDDSYVIETDNRVIEDLLKMMGERFIHIPRAMKIMFVAKYLERIADHDVHMSERVVFMVVGKIIRHRDAASYGFPKE